MEQLQPFLQGVVEWPVAAAAEAYANMELQDYSLQQRSQMNLYWVWVGSVEGTAWL